MLTKSQIGCALALPSFSQAGGHQDTSSYQIMSIGPSAAAGEVETYGRKARKYIRIGYCLSHSGGQLKGSGLGLVGL